MAKTKKYAIRANRSKSHPHYGINRSGRDHQRYYHDRQEMKPEHLFLSPGQAQNALFRFDRAIRRAERIGVDVMKKLVTPKDIREDKTGRVNQLKGPPIPSHIHERAIQARFYLQQAGVAAR